MCVAAPGGPWRFALRNVFGNTRAYGKNQLFEGFVSLAPKVVRCFRFFSTKFNFHCTQKQQQCNATLSGAYLQIPVSVRVCVWTYKQARPWNWFQPVTYLKMLLLLVGGNLLMVLLLLSGRSVGWLLAVVELMRLLLLLRCIMLLVLLWRTGCHIIPVNGYVDAGTCRWTVTSVAAVAGLVSCYHSWLHLVCHKRILSLSVFG